MESVVQSQWLRLDQGQWLGLDQGKVSHTGDLGSIVNVLFSQKCTLLRKRTHE